MTNAQTTEPRRLHSLVSDEGWVILHWRCTEADALRFVEMNGYQAGDRLIGPTGKTIRTYPYPL